MRNYNKCVVTKGNPDTVRPEYLTIIFTFHLRSGKSFGFGVREDFVSDLNKCVTALDYAKVVYDSMNKQVFSAQKDLIEQIITYLEPFNEDDYNQEFTELLDSVF